MCKLLNIGLHRLDDFARTLKGLDAETMSDIALWVLGRVKAVPTDDGEGPLALMPFDEGPKVLQVCPPPAAYVAPKGAARYRAGAPATPGKVLAEDDPLNKPYTQKPREKLGLFGKKKTPNTESLPTFGRT